MAGRPGKYETHIAPRLPEIRKWIVTMNEKQIAQKLGLASSTFARYKAAHKELQQALIEGQQDLCDELKDALKRKARGYEYQEEKVVEKTEKGKVVSVTKETYKKYAHPDTGAIHLLLKNLDPAWHNDDTETLNIKKKQVEIQEMATKQREWS